MEELHDLIPSYCRKLLSYEQSLYVTNNVMSDLFFVSDPDQYDCPCFADVVIHIINRKKNDIASNARVVSNKNHIKHFQTLPWWFKWSVLVDYAVQENQRMTKLTSRSKLDFDCDIGGLNETCQQPDEDSSIYDFCHETRDKMSDVEDMAKKLGQQLELQKVMNIKLKTELRELLEMRLSDISESAKRGRAPKMIHEGLF